MNEFSTHTETPQAPPPAASELATDGTHHPQGAGLGGAPAETDAVRARREAAERDRIQIEGQQANKATSDDAHRSQQELASERRTDERRQAETEQEKQVEATRLAKMSPAEREAHLKGKQSLEAQLAKEAEAAKLAARQPNAAELEKQRIAREAKATEQAKADHAKELAQGDPLRRPRVDLNPQGRKADARAEAAGHGHISPMSAPPGEDADSYYRELVIHQDEYIRELKVALGRSGIGIPVMSDFDSLFRNRHPITTKPTTAA